MTLIRTLWSSAQTDPRLMRRLNGWLTILWIAMIPVSLVTGWVRSVTFVAALSLWALVSGHWSAWQAARVEQRQDDDANVVEVLEEIRQLRADIEDLRGPSTQAPARVTRELPLRLARAGEPEKRV